MAGMRLFLPMSTMESEFESEPRTGTLFFVVCLFWLQPYRVTFDVEYGFCHFTNCGLGFATCYRSGSGDVFLHVLGSQTPLSILGYVDE